MKLEEITAILDNTRLQRETVHYKPLNQDCIKYKDNHLTFTCNVNENTYTAEYLLIYKGETNLELMIKTIHAQMNIDLDEINTLTVT